MLPLYHEMSILTSGTKQKVLFMTLNWVDEKKIAKKNKNAKKKTSQNKISKTFKFSFDNREACKKAHIDTISPLTYSNNNHNHNHDNKDLG